MKFTTVQNPKRYKLVEARPRYKLVQVRLKDTVGEVNPNWYTPRNLNQRRYEHRNPQRPSAQDKG